MDFFEFCVEFFKLLESVGLCFFAKFGGISAMIYSNPFPVLHFSFSPPHDSKEWMLALLLQFYRSLRLYVFPSGCGVFFFFPFHCLDWVIPTVLSVHQFSSLSSPFWCSAYRVKLPPLFGYCVSQFQCFHLILLFIFFLYWHFLWLNFLFFILFFLF